MCERYVMPEAAQAEQEFGVLRRWWRFSPSFNVGPQRNVPIVRRHDGEVEGVMLRWGLIPEWAEADAARASVPHVPAETLEHSELTRIAWQRGRRCIVPMFGFYMWQLTWERYRQPFFVRLVNRPVFGVAALWDRSEAEDSDDVVESCALITVPPNPLMAELQDSVTPMPAILDRRDYAVWLTAAPIVAESVLQSYAPDKMIAHPVSPRVNSLRNDDAQLIQPVEHAARQGLTG
jgi:putative SOS response-associated peptidase YedK